MHTVMFDLIHEWVSAFALRQREKAACRVRCSLGPNYRPGHTKEVYIHLCIVANMYELPQVIPKTEQQTLAMKFALVLLWQRQKKKG